jgi:hypothetical protein
MNQWDWNGWRMGDLFFLFVFVAAGLLFNYWICTKSYNRLSAIGSFVIGVAFALLGLLYLEPEKVTYEPGSFFKGRERSSPLSFRVMLSFICALPLILWVVLIHSFYWGVPSEPDEDDEDNDAEDSEES